LGEASDHKPAGSRGAFGEASDHNVPAAGGLLAKPLTITCRQPLQQPRDGLGKIPQLKNARAATAEPEGDGLPLHPSGEALAHPHDLHGRPLAAGRGWDATLVKDNGGSVRGLHMLGCSALGGAGLKICFPGQKHP
jgi:hypothetical protein